MKKLSIIIPAYNEEKTLSTLIEKVKAAQVYPLEKEIIVIDNNSKDQTFSVAKDIPDIRVIKEIIPGKGAAVKAGFRVATGDIFLIQDADLEYDPNDYRAVVEPILSGKTELTNGVRTDGRNQSDWKIYFLGYIGNTIITWTTNVLYLNNAKEYEGCYKAITKKLSDSIQIKSDDFAFDNELICKALKRGIKPIDVPIRYFPRDYSEGKKINWKHGLRILWVIWKTRFCN